MTPPGVAVRSRTPTGHRAFPRTPPQLRAGYPRAPAVTRRFLLPRAGARRRSNRVPPAGGVGPPPCRREGMIGSCRPIRRNVRPPRCRDREPALDARHLLRTPVIVHDVCVRMSTLRPPSTGDRPPARVPTRRQSAASARSTRHLRTATVWRAEYVDLAREARSRPVGCSTARIALHEDAVEHGSSGNRSNLVRSAPRDRCPSDAATDTWRSPAAASWMSSGPRSRSHG
jgi:hypothetical protein